MRTLRGAIVGYGFIAEGGHVPAYLASGGAQDRARFDIVAVADATPARLALAARRLPRARMYDDYRAMLEREARDLDFVDVAAPPYLHAEVTHAALDAGLHVLCEKPLTATAAEARAMLAHAASARRVLFPSHNYKHAPVVREVRAMLDEGVIGEVGLVTLHTFRASHARGVAEWRPDWRRERRFSGGGIAMDHGAHTFYLAFDWLKGAPRAVSARAWTLGPHDTEDNLACSVTFDRGIATAHLTWTAGVRKVIYSLHGERGAIRVEDDEVELSLRTRTPEGDRWEARRRNVASAWMDASHAGWFGALQQRFAEAVERGDFAGSEARDAARCVELIEAAYASSEQGGREVALDARGAR